MAGEEPAEAEDEPGRAAPEPAQGRQPSSHAFEGLHILQILNNSCYLIWLLSKDPNITPNEVARWRYTELLHALGCNGWFAARVTTCGEFDQTAALQRQRAAPGQCWQRTRHKKVIPFRVLQNEPLCTGRCRRQREAAPVQNGYLKSSLSRPHLTTTSAA